MALRRTPASLKPSRSENQVLANEAFALRNFVLFSQKPARAQLASVSSAPYPATPLFQVIVRPQISPRQTYLINQTIKTVLQLIDFEKPKLYKSPTKIRIALTNFANRVEKKAFIEQKKTHKELLSDVDADTFFDNKPSPVLTRQSPSLSLEKRAAFAMTDQPSKALQPSVASVLEDVAPTKDPVLPLLARSHTAPTFSQPSSLGSTGLTSRMRGISNTVQPIRPVPQTGQGSIETFTQPLTESR